MPTYDYRCNNCGVIEIFHSIMDPDRIVCPKCNTYGLSKLISVGGAVIISGREANQYSDIKAAKYWRDKNGVRHRVTEADGYTSSATVSHQTVSNKEVKKRKERDQRIAKQKRIKLQKDRANAWNREHLK